jgi:hypothetical protein
MVVKDFDAVHALPIHAVQAPALEPWVCVHIDMSTAYEMVKCCHWAFLAIRQFDL